MRRILGVSAAAMLLASCGGDREGTIETEDGDLEYSIDESSGNAQFRLEDDEGQQISVNTGANVAIDLPDGYTVYPGATVVSNSVINANDGAGSIVMLTTPDSPDKVAAFYRAQAEAAGITIQMETTAQGSKMIAGESGDGKTFSLSANPGDEGTMAQLIVGSQLGE
ncbi:hypothetical protein GCM10009127_25400 [Alteraurantiacibacter aestuarii]|uniref:hypothetical protein n=1 Tax=Alteraurantiacibacter aestuarii TaxID=650004 RepID=UPI0031DC0D99